MKILGLDLGSNSIGWALRDTILPDNQFEKYGVITFSKGVGTEKGVEYSFAAERTKNRSLRRRYQAHKYKLWATLDVLIANDYCPLPVEDLDRWRKYEKGKGRVYPVDNTAFANWIKLDFDEDGKPNYTSPYQLRLELVTELLDFTVKKNRYKLGRALYHIAQHRAFKSSKKVQDKEESKPEDDYIGAEKKRAKFIQDLCAKHEVTTVGAAFAKEENAGNRIRKNLQQHVIRKQLQDEVKQIFQFQNLSFADLFKKDVSKSSIFWQRPLRSQKGSIGKCTLEPSKYRCPVSHPAFEAFTAWSFINTIEYRIKGNKESKWEKLDFALRKELYEDRFFRMSDFDFIDIRNFIKKKTGHENWDFNYKDKTNVSASVVSARLKDIFGDDWNNYHLQTEDKRQIRKSDGSLSEHAVSYNIEDVWHILFSFDDEDDVRSFAKDKLGLQDKAEKFVSLWYKMPVAYGMLSLKAINNILPFLEEGKIYTEAVLLAKIPEVLGKEMWEQNKQNLTENISLVIEDNKEKKKLLTIVNNLIGQYKSQDNTLKFAERDFAYTLQADDYKEAEAACAEAYGQRTWNEFSKEKREEVLKEVTAGYQSFFADKKREFKRLPHLLDTLKEFLKDHFTIQEKKLSKLYHPSQISVYPPAKEKYYEEHHGNFTLLGSPKTGAFKNPVAMRALHELNKLINYLLTTEQIDEETAIVVEIARELNDANMRWAIETYQRRRQEENKEFANAIIELLQEHPASKANPDNNEDIDKFRLWFEQMNDEEIVDGKNEYAKHEWANTKSKVYKQVAAASEMIEKYRLWKHQDCLCIYTGRFIGMADLFAENSTDFEHTIARSLSFDNSLANLTVCDFVYNRTVKKNQLPVNLPNYDTDISLNGKTYTAIKPRLKKWEEKIESIKNNIEFWVKKAKQAATKEDKDKAIRQRHLWKFELDYWRNKLDRFTLTEVKSGFKNSQLTDTQIISNYAFHYLKTVFNSVKVQKGSITAEFRKIYGVQPKDEKKDRSRHSHHAKDAAVLTLIPVDAKREEILKKNYDYDEATHKQYHEQPYKGFKQSYIEEIESHILINNIQKDQSLTPGKKRVRTRGKKVLLRDKNGKILLDENGNEKEKWAKGDSIRGQLHLDTYYGKIKIVKRDKDGKLLKTENGDWDYSDKNEGFGFVVRKEINKDLKVESIVDPYIKALFVQQMSGRNLDKTLKEDGAIWMLNKTGEKAHAMRHVRTFANDVTEPLAIKKQTNVSSKDYKTSYWVKNGENYAYALYQGIVKNKIERGFQLINLFDAIQLASLDDNKKLDVEKEITINKKGDKLQLYAILKSGQKILFIQSEPNELSDMTTGELSNRLYYIRKFKKDGRIFFQHHLEARKDEELGDGVSTLNFDRVEPRYFLSKTNFNFLIENEDFLFMPDGSVAFINE